MEVNALPTASGGYMEPGAHAPARPGVAERRAPALRLAMDCTAVDEGGSELHIQ